MGGSKLKEFTIERKLTDDSEEIHLGDSERDGLKVSGQVELNK